MYEYVSIGGELSRDVDVCIYEYGAQLEMVVN